jgi:hypothetical protein
MCSPTFLNKFLIQYIITGSLREFVQENMEL